MIVMGREALDAGCASAKAVKSGLGAGEMALMLTETAALTVVVMGMLIVIVAMGEGMKGVPLVSEKGRLNVIIATDTEESEHIAGIVMDRVAGWNKFVLAVRLFPALRSQIKQP